MYLSTQDGLREKSMSSEAKYENTGLLSSRYEDIKSYHDHVPSELRIWKSIVMLIYDYIIKGLLHSAI